MKTIIIATILSIFLHLLTLYLLGEKKLSKNLQKPNSSSKTIDKQSIKFITLKAKQKNTKKKVIKKKTNNQIRKDKYKKVNKIVKTAKREVLKKEAKEVKVKTKKIVEVTPKYSKLNPTKLQKQTLEDFLSTPKNINDIDMLTQSYIKLYGEEFNSFTKVQKVFLKNSLKTIGQITQKYLEYPDIAIRLFLEGKNIVEFFLYPNGDIKDLRITNSSGHSFFDKNTLSAIKTAYKDYPKPKEITKIKIYVNYIIR